MRALINAASEVLRLFPYGPHFTPDQNRALASLTAAGPIAIANEESAQADRESWQELCDLMDAALPDFRGLPAPTDHARLALQKLISDRAALLVALKNIREAAFSAMSQDCDQWRAMVAAIEQSEAMR